MSFVFLYLSKHEFFRHFTVKKTSLPLPAERLSCLYIQRVAYRKANWKECGKSVSSDRNFLLYLGEIKGLKAVFRLILSERNRFATTEHTKFLVFVFMIDEIPAIFSNLGDWRAAKTRAFLITFFRSEARVEYLCTRC